MKDVEPDFLDEVIAESIAKNPEFGHLVERARRNREVLTVLRRQRQRARISQKAVAEAMSTTQSAVSDLETNTSDAKISTVEKYAGALGLAVQFHLLPIGQAATQPVVVVHGPGEEPAT